MATPSVTTPGTSARMRISSLLSKMSTGGAYVGRSAIFSASRFFTFVSFMVFLLSLSLGLHRDLPRLRFGDLRQRDGEHAVLQRRRALLGVDLAGQREAAGELHRGALLAVHEPALRHVLAALAAHRQ